MAGDRAAQRGLGGGGVIARDTGCVAEHPRRDARQRQPRQRIGAAVDHRQPVVAAAVQQAGDGLADMASAEQCNLHEAASFVATPAC